MKTQEILGLPLNLGLTFIKQEFFSINIVETFSPNSKSKIKDNDNDKVKDPYIIRIREESNELLEILVSYF